MDILLIILSGLCSMIWTINTISYVVDVETLDYSFLIMKALNAVIWITIFIRQMSKYLRRYREAQKAIGTRGDGPFVLTNPSEHDKI